MRRDSRLIRSHRVRPALAFRVLAQPANKFIPVLKKECATIYSDSDGVTYASECAKNDRYAISALSRSLFASS
jgi:hypothetical protein